MREFSSVSMHPIVLLLSLFFAHSLWAAPTFPNLWDQLATDLGNPGNQNVVMLFEKYQALNRHCTTSSSVSSKLRKVLLTGFGPFGHRDKNISGRVATSLLNVPLTSSNELPKTQWGGWSGHRTLTIEGTPVELCVLYLDVEWDLAAAIILEEARHFAPEVLLMTGQGSGPATLEGRVQNVASARPGFGPNGEALDEKNHPFCEGHLCQPEQLAPVLPLEDPGVEEEIPLSWDNESLANAITSVFGEEMLVIAPQEINPDNDYICNNIAFISQIAANGFPVHLAGGELVLQLHTPIRCRQL